MSGNTIPLWPPATLPVKFVAGDPVRVRFESGKMLVIRPNGQHLETTIINPAG
jgi:hypothetical protein